MSTPTYQRPERRIGAPRVALIVTASIVSLIAFGLLSIGGLSLWGNAQKDSQGYLTTDSERFSTSTRALATDNLDVDADAPGWLVDSDSYGKVRLKVDPNTDKPVFVGIAPTDEAERYLAGTSHATVTDVDYSPFEAEYRTQAGDRKPTAPVEQYFWKTSTHGPGEQTLTWDVEHGDWSVVVMNADGSPGVDAGVSAGANVPILATIGWVSIGTGGFLLTVAGGLLVLAIRTPRRRNGTAATMTPAHAVV